MSEPLCMCGEPLSRHHVNMDPSHTFVDCPEPDDDNACPECGYYLCTCGGGDEETGDFDTDDYGVFDPSPFCYLCGKHEYLRCRCCVGSFRRLPRAAKGRQKRTNRTRLVQLVRKSGKIPF